MKNIIEKLRIYGPRVFIQYLLIDLKRKIWFQMVKGSYSQQAEDLQIHKILKRKKTGFYVDIGAYDPDRFSNTKMFYKMGWNGINIEPNTINYQKFLKERIRDINLNIGIGNKEGDLSFFLFIPDTLSTFSESEADDYIKQGYKLVEKVKVPVKKLANVLKEHAKNKQLDFFSIDTEGLDMDVLKSNDWDLFNPKVICIESASHSHTNTSKKEDSIDGFLKSKGYKEVYSNSTNSIYVKT